MRMDLVAEPQRSIQPDAIMGRSACKNSRMAFVETTMEGREVSRSHDALQHDGAIEDDGAVIQAIHQRKTPAGAGAWVSRR